jgi:deoxyribodipyrimidine photo-lyase
MAWIYIFHRDLRLIDNNALEALASEKIIPVFIFTPEQVTTNKYKSTNAIQFMLESLEDLDAALRKRGSKLHMFYGKIEDVLDSISAPITGIADGADYTPYAKERTQRLAAWAEAAGKEFRQTHDIYLNAPGAILTTTGRPYQKFTPFYEESLKHAVAAPRTSSALHFVKVSTPGQVTLKAMWERLVPHRNESLHVHGGRTNGLSLLKRLPTVLPTYAEAKDNPAMDTSWLSAHNHFGTVSIREVYAAAKQQPEFIRQLYWREFYGHLIAAFEDLYKISPYKFEGKRKWRTGAAARRDYDAWCNGKTGIDIVDAGMRQLKETGYIPNRVRLIVGSYLVNELQLPWHLGEEHFSKYLVDIDYAQNTGNWTWLDGSLPYGQNPLRVMSVERQQERFTPFNI